MNEELKIVLKKLGYTNPSYDSINDLAQKYYSKFKRREKELPYWINLVEVMNLGYRGSGKNENGHSRFLYELFRYNSNGTHPVINSLMNRFTDRKGFKSKSGENKIAVNSTFSETGRHPDIYINQLEVYDSDETISIVFENKIDHAEDRDKQMQDYIIGMHKEKNNGKIILDSNCYAFYLISDCASKRNDTAHDTLGRQCVDEKKVLDILIPDKNYILLSYKEDILPWLKNDLLFSLKEKYLIDNVKIYVQYLNNRFGQIESINDIKIKVMNTLEGIWELTVQELCILQDGVEKYIIKRKKEEIINSFSSILGKKKFQEIWKDGELGKGYKLKLIEGFSIWCELNINGSKEDFHIGIAIDDPNGDKISTYNNYIALFGKNQIEKCNIEINQNPNLVEDTDSTGSGYIKSWTFRAKGLDNLKNHINYTLPDILIDFIDKYPREEGSK